MELYVQAAQLGLGATNSTFNFQVYGYDQYGVEDESAPGRFDYARYPFAWDDDALEPGPADRTAEIEVRVNDAEGYAYSMPKGVMIVDYTGNPDNGGETYLFDVTVDLALDLTVLHTNDFHAHVDEYNVNGGGANRRTRRQACASQARRGWRRPYRRSETVNPTCCCWTQATSSRARCSSTSSRAMC